MNKRKIIDYIVVKGNLETNDLLASNNGKISSIRNEIKTFEKILEKCSKDLKRYIFLKKEFNVFKDLKRGVEYKPICREKTLKWEKEVNYGISSDEFFKHPLGTIQFVTDSTKKLTREKDNYIKNSRLKIDERINNLNKSINSYQIELKSKESYLKELESVENHLENINLRTDFEKEIINIQNQGYELLGGVSSNKYNLFQSMVKYEK